MISFSLLMLLTSASLGQPMSSSTEEAIDWDDYAPCGLVSLYLVCRLQEKAVGWEEVKKLVGSAGPGGELSFADLSTAASRLGMHPVGLETGRSVLSDLPMPAIVQVHDVRFPDELPHFLVLLRPEVDGVWLLDAPYAAYFLPQDRFLQSWTSKILIFASDQQEAKQISDLADESIEIQRIGWGLIAGGLAFLAILGLISFTRCCRARIWNSAAVVNETLSQGSAGFFARKPLLIACSSAFLIACLVPIVLLLSFSRDNDVAARCEFDEQVIGLGELTPGMNNIHVRIKNTGNNPLHITRVASNCTCGAIVKYPDHIEPHQSAMLDVQLSVLPGPRAIQLTCESNDPQGPKHVVLSWYGKAKPTLIPRWISSANVPLDRPYERTIQLMYPGGKSSLVPQLKSCTCDSEDVEVREGRNDPMARKFVASGLLTKVLGELELHLRIRPPSKAGYFFTLCKLSLIYGDSLQTITLPISLTFAGGQLTPDVGVVSFSGTEDQQLLCQERLVRIADQDPRGDIEVLGTPPWIKCEIHRKTENEHLLRLKIISVPSAPFSQHCLQIVRKRSASPRSTLRVNVFHPPKPHSG